MSGRPYPPERGGGPHPRYTGCVTAPLDLTDIGFVRDGRAILDRVSLRVVDDEHWVVLGPNGCGKTTLLRIAALYEHPSSGQVSVLGERLGSTDVRTLRRRIGYASAALAAQLRPDLAAVDVVMTARFAALEPWWHRYDDSDRLTARDRLGVLGVAHLADRPIGSLSSGEQQRILLARTLMNDPAVVLLDEPSARLDLGGREQLVGALAEMASRPGGPPYVLVTHHVDEIPPGTTHAMLVRDGRAVAVGPIDEVLTAEALSHCFAMRLALERRADGRFSAWATR